MLPHRFFKYIVYSPVVLLIKNLFSISDFFETSTPICLSSILHCIKKNVAKTCSQLYGVKKSRSFSVLMQAVLKLFRQTTAGGEEVENTISPPPRVKNFQVVI